VAGDVTGTVVALNADGTSGFINHSVSSTDPAYNGIFAPGVPVSVSGNAVGQVVIGQIAGGPTVVQDGAPGTGQATYTVALGVAPPAPGTKWYVTVAPAPDPRADGGSSVQVSTDGTNWFSALVLTFDSSAATGTATDWYRTQTVYVRTTSTSVLTGDQTIEVMHSLFSTTPVSSTLVGFADVPITNVEVHVVDGDLPGIVVNQPASGLQVLEGSSTVVGQYTVTLTKAPAAGETVTVSLSTDDSRLVVPAPLTFTAANWFIPQTVTITATDDGIVQGERLSTITSSVHSSIATGGVYSNGVVDNPVLKIDVIDADSGGVIVLQPTGQTVVAPGHPGTYTLQLTKAPTAAVTVTLLDDGQTLLSSLTSDPRFHATGGSGGAPYVVFAAGDTSPIILTVTVNPNAPAVVGNQPIQVFPAQPHVTTGIYGPLFIEGGEVSPRELVIGIRLPTEIDVALPNVASQQSNAPTLNTLNVFNDGSVSADTGHLGAISSAEFATLSNLYASQFAGGLAQWQFGEIDGLGMTGPLTITRGLVNPLTFAGGITYRNIDVVNVMLGQGDDTFTVTATVRNTITLIQGGGGNNALTATGGGGYNSPLMLFASTSQNGQYYNSTTANITGWAREFTYPTSGHSVLDATLDPNSVILYGGRGSAWIYGGAGGDQIAGGSGLDQIRAGTGNDIIHVNDGFNIDLTHPLSQIVGENLPALTVAHDPQFNDSPTHDPLTPTSDQVYGGMGHDIVFLDHGVVDQLSNPITGTIGVLDAYTTDPTSFGLSSVFGGYGSSTVVLAGTGSQNIDLSHTTQANVVVKNGYVYFAAPDSWTRALARVGSTDPGAGGNDRITVGEGNDVIVAGTGFDRITGGGGDKIVLGDDGQITWAGGQLVQIISKDPGVSQYSTFANTISLGNGNDIIFGGSGANTITAGNGNDIVVAANGELDFQGGQPTTLKTIFPTAGGNNKVTLGGGNGVVIGGPGNSTINAGSGYTIVSRTGEAVYSRSTRRWSDPNAQAPVLSGTPSGAIAPATSPAVTVAPPQATAPVIVLKPLQPKPKPKPKHKKTKSKSKSKTKTKTKTKRHTQLKQKPGQPKTKKHLTKQHSG
jgi:hypothetical protein